jgi:membrane-associated protease RseP (regulator of RpoE activity)
VRFDFGDNRMWLKRTGDPRVTHYGADYELSKRVGATISRVQGGYTVWNVKPDGAAAAFGLREGDQIVVPEGDEMVSVEEVLAGIEQQEELTVARREGDVWIDRILPDPTSREAGEEGTTPAGSPP